MPNCERWANWSEGVPDEADVVTIASPPEQGPLIDETVAVICAEVDGPGHELQGNNSMDITGGGLVMASAITHLLDRSFVGCPYILKLHIRILHHQML